MNSGKSKSKLKVREPYGKVTEVGQIPVALQEIRELIGRPDGQWNVAEVKTILDSIISVTSANLGCLSDLAESPKCCGCDATLAFIWTDQETGRKNPYCSACDDKLIQDVELPNRKTATMAS